MAAKERAAGWSLASVVRCHARGVTVSDARTKVWAAAFLPAAVDWPAASDGGDPAGPAAAYAVTAGETSLAVHDVATGAVVLKYQHPEREDFYCAATTVLPQPRRQAAPWRLPVVAAAGGAGTVKLISPAHRVCYAELRGHRRNINALVFDPSAPRHLYSGGADAAVLAWDIGSLDQTTPAVLRARYGGLGAAVVSLALCPARDGPPWLLCGTEDGAVHVVRATGTAGPPVCVLRSDAFHLSTVDLIEPLGDRLAVSKGATDGRLLVWDVPASVAAGAPVVVGALAYVDTDIFFIKGSVRRLGDLWLLAVGTPEGDVHLYELPCAQWEHAAAAAPGPLGTAIPPTTILRPPPKARGLVRRVDVSDDGAYVVVVTDNNLVLTWQRTR